MMDHDRTRSFKVFLNVFTIYRLKAYLQNTDSVEHKSYKTFNI